MTEQFEHFIQSLAQELPYPPMPESSVNRAPMMQPLVLKRIAGFLLVLLLAGLAVPEIRARVIDFLQLGAVTITLDGYSTTGDTLRLEDVSGEVPLDAIQNLVSFDVRFTPDDLPDYTYVQDEMVIFVWVENDNITKALYQISTFNWGVIKSASEFGVESTTVHQQEAFWIRVQHPVQFVNGTTELTHFVTGNVLVWEENGITYRLETPEDIEAAKAFAESLE